MLMVPIIINKEIAQKLSQITISLNKLIIHAFTKRIVRQKLFYEVFYMKSLAFIKWGGRLQ